MDSCFMLLRFAARDSLFSFIHKLFNGRCACEPLSLCARVRAREKERASEKGRERERVCIICVKHIAHYQMSVHSLMLTLPIGAKWINTAIDWFGSINHFVLIAILELIVRCCQTVPPKTKCNVWREATPIAINLATIRAYAYTRKGISLICNWIYLLSWGRNHIARRGTQREWLKGGLCHSIATNYRIHWTCNACTYATYANNVSSWSGLEQASLHDAHANQLTRVDSEKVLVFVFCGYFYHQNGIFSSFKWPSSWKRFSIGQCAAYHVRHFSHAQCSPICCQHFSHYLIVTLLVVYACMTIMSFIEINCLLIRRKDAYIFNALDDEFSLHTHTHAHVQNTATVTNK